MNLESRFVCPCEVGDGDVHQGGTRASFRGHHQYTNKIRSGVHSLAQPFEGWRDVGRRRMTKLSMCFGRWRSDSWLWLLAFGSPTMVRHQFYIRRYGMLEIIQICIKLS
jgi:hypothetical protein